MNYEELHRKYEDLQRQLIYYQEYDALTGVYNKNTFYQKVKACLDDNSGETYNIICVDVERFKVINDIYGTEKGNEILKYLAENMNQKVQEESGLFARLSADIFTGFLTTNLEAYEIEEEIISIFERAPLDMNITPAIGIYHITDRKLAVQQMCDRAILALNTVKGNFMKHCAVYNETMRSHLLEEQEILSRANIALEKGEFKVFMQPKCNMKTGKIVGAEALVRWDHPQKGMIPPSVFIPVFERNGFVKKLDLYIWEEVAKWLASWSERGNSLLPVSVNVSRVDIIGIDLRSVLHGIIQKYNVDPVFLELEITESAYTTKLDEIVVTVEDLMKTGFTVLMDDFGSGYSSLNILKDINIDILKLDMRFLDNTDKKSRDILESIIQMAKWLDIRVIAEGVEYESQVNFLLNMGCIYAQGYYYYKPMTIEDFENTLNNPSSVDCEDGQRAHEFKDNEINFKDLFYADMMTDQLLNNILGGVALYQYDGETMKIQKCNQQYYWLTHHEQMPVSLDEENIMSHVLKEDQEILIRALREAKVRGDKGVEVNVRRKFSDDGFVWLQLRLYYLSDTNRKSIYYAGVSDVTDQMQAIENLRLSEQLFRTAMEASGNTLFEVDIETRVASFARHSQEEFGLSDCIANAPEGFIEQGSVYPGFENDFREMYEAIYRGEDRATCTIRACMGDGSVVWNRITLMALKDKDGKPVKAVGLVENVTKEKLLETQLKKMSHVTE